MVKRISIICLISIMLIGLNACKGVNKNTLVVGTALSYPPYEYKEENKIVGIDIDILLELTSRMGKDFVIETMAFDDLFNALEYHKIDVIAAGLTITDDRKERLNFTVPYDSGHQCIVTKIDNEIESIEDLRNVNVLVGVEIGTVGDDLAKENCAIIQIKDYDDATKMMEALESDIINTIIVDNATADKFLEKYSDLEKIDIESTQEEFGLAFAKDSEYYEQANSILKEMIEDGTVENIIKKYKEK